MESVKPRFAVEAHLADVDTVNRLVRTQRPVEEKRETEQDAGIHDQ